MNKRITMEIRFFYMDHELPELIRIEGVPLVLHQLDAALFGLQKPQLGSEPVTINISTASLKTTAWDANMLLWNRVVIGGIWYVYSSISGLHKYINKVEQFCWSVSRPVPDDMRHDIANTLTCLRVPEEIIRKMCPGTD